MFILFTNWRRAIFWFSCTRISLLVWTNIPSLIYLSSSLSKVIRFISLGDFAIHCPIFPGFGMKVTLMFRHTFGLYPKYAAESSVNPVNSTVICIKWVYYPFNFVRIHRFFDSLLIFSVGSFTSFQSSVFSMVCDPAKWTLKNSLIVSINVLLYSPNLFLRGRIFWSLSILECFLFPHSAYFGNLSWLSIRHCK